MHLHLLCHPGHPTSLRQLTAIAALSTTLAAALAGPAAAQPSPGASRADPASAFNPALSLVMSGQYLHRSRPGTGISGLRLPADAETGPGERGFSLGEVELSLEAPIDPAWRGRATLAISDGGTAVEEAYVRHSALAPGLSLTAGRFKSGIGYLNSRHAHTWDFADAPLAYQALLGGGYHDDGVQLAWLAPTERYLQLGLEIGRGAGFPAGGEARNGAGAAALTAHLGGDWGSSHSWRVGASLLSARAGDQALSATDASGAASDSRFAGRTRVWVLDGVWKWAPEGNATRQNLTLQAEWLQATRSGTLWTPDGGGGELANPDWRLRQSGWYAQAVWQFMPRWRVGTRTEALSTGQGDAALSPAAQATGALGADGQRLRKHSVMLDFNPSEFSRWRLQLASDRSAPGGADRQLLLQYQMSLGAHGAHSF